MDLSSKNAILDSQEDRISSLPDEVLIHILSFMVTRDSFRTCILSSRWEELWASVPYLSLGPGYWNPQHYTFKDFILEYSNFIERVLLLHNSTIHQFHLICSSEIDKSRFNAWISSVVKRGVLDITISAFDCPNFQLPRSLLTCGTLEILKLVRNVQFSVPSTIYLPRLKVLHVQLTNPSKDLTEKLFCSSPMLEELKVEVEDDSGRSNYIISSPALKKLSIHIDAEGLNEDCRSVVLIDAPVLEVLEVCKYGYVRYTLKNTSSIVRASVDQRGFGEGTLLLSNLYKLLTQISEVKSLTLDYYSMAAMKGVTEKKWPIFYNVTHLNLEVSEFCFSFESLSEWPNFPNLSHLHLYVSGEMGSETSIIMRFQKVFSTAQRLCGFDPSWRGMPTCLQSSVNEIEIRKLECRSGVMELIKYLLESTQALEKLTIELPERVYSSEEGLQMKILAMPRFSEICQVVFV